MAAGALVRLLGAMGSRGRARLAGVLGSLAYALGIRRRITLDNLRHAFPDTPREQLETIARSAYRNMMLAGLESVAGPQLSPEAVESTVVVDDWRTLKEIADARRPVLVASAHFGSWELFAEVMTRRGYALNAVVRPLEGSFNARIMEARKRSGMKLIAPRGAVHGILRALGAGEPVTMLLDQAIPAPQGVFVPFFGRLASTSPALAIAALRTGAPVFVALAARDGDTRSTRWGTMSVSSGWASRSTRRRSPPR
jgi:KDO2-lipid IV(A) lauroyltransferase